MNHETDPRRAEWLEHSMYWECLPWNAGVAAFYCGMPGLLDTVKFFCRCGQTSTGIFQNAGFRIECACGMVASGRSE